MSNLILSVVALVLVIALSLASVFYGGDVYVSQQAKALAATLDNQGQQIYGASVLYQEDTGYWPAHLALLAIDSKYLKTVPLPPDGIYALAGDEHEAPLSLIAPAHAEASFDEEEGTGDVPPDLYELAKSDPAGAIQEIANRGLVTPAARDRVIGLPLDQAKLREVAMLMAQETLKTEGTPNLFDWALPDDGYSNPKRRYVLLENQVSEEVCKAVNLRSREVAEIPVAPNATNVIQCFGASAPYTYLYLFPQASGSAVCASLGEQGTPCEVVACDGGAIVDSVSPSSGESAGGFPVTVEGSCLLGTEISICGETVIPTVASAASISVTAPACPEGPTDIVITSPNRPGTPALTIPFEYVPAFVPEVSKPGYYIVSWRGDGFHADPTPRASCPAGYWVLPMDKWGDAGGSQSAGSFWMEESTLSYYHPILLGGTMRMSRNPIRNYYYGGDATYPSDGYSYVNPYGVNNAGEGPDATYTISTSSLANNSLDFCLKTEINRIKNFSPVSTAQNRSSSGAEVTSPYNASHSGVIYAYAARRLNWGDCTFSSYRYSSSRPVETSERWSYIYDNELRVGGSETAWPSNVMTAVHVGCDYTEPDLSPSSEVWMVAVLDTIGLGTHHTTTRVSDGSLINAHAQHYNVSATENSLTFDHVRTIGGGPDEGFNVDLVMDRVYQDSDPSYTMYKWVRDRDHQYRVVSD